MAGRSIKGYNRYEYQEMEAENQREIDQRPKKFCLLSKPVPEAPSCPWSHGLGPKKLSASVTVPPAPVRVPSQRPLAPSVASVTSVANDKDDNEMILGAVYRSPGIFLTAE